MAADYRHIGGHENRLGRHYSRFSAFSPTPALAGQSLALRKLCDAASNRRSQARTLRVLRVVNPVSLVCAGARFAIANQTTLPSNHAESEEVITGMLEETM